MTAPREPLRRRRAAVPLACTLAAALAAAACGGSAAHEDSTGAPLVPPGFDDDGVLTLLTLSPLPDAPPDPTNRVADDPRAAELGQLLFFDARLSKAGDTSCATCHDPRASFVDGEPLAEGVLPLDRHTPALWNVAYQRWFFWDGRADSLWSQALVPLESPLEHATSRVAVARVVCEDPRLRALYEAVFGPLPPCDDRERFPEHARPVPEDDHAHVLARRHAAEARRAAAERGDGDAGHHHLGGSGFVHPHQRAWDAMHPDDRRAATEVFVNVGKALAAYERRILSTRSRFDDFVRAVRTGDADGLDVLDESERRGLALFVGDAGCTNCHHGPTLSDLEFHDTGVPDVDGAPDDDPGRARGIEVVRSSEFNVAGPWSDDPDGPARVKLDYLPVHVHAGREFKTPTLRNVALTPPYMHHGGLATLEDVVDFYADRAGARPTPETVLRPLDLDARQRADLVAFLRTLTDDDIDPDLLRNPHRDRRTPR